MAARKKEVEKELKITLKEVGPIKPWFDKDVDSWVFESNLYPVGCSGDSSEAVKEKCPLYLEEFIEQRLKNNLNVRVEKRTVERGGKREGAGRPKAVDREEKKRVYLPVEIALWIQSPQTITNIRNLMKQNLPSLEEAAACSRMA